MDLSWAVQPFLVTVVTTIVIVGLARSLMQGRASALRNPEREAQCEAAGFKVSASLLGAPEVRGSLHETPFVLRATPGAKGTPPMTTISVPDALGPNFAITREGSRDLSGNDLIDSMFPDAGTREAVRALFAQGFDTILLSGGTLRATRTFKAEVLAPPVLDAAVAQLAVIRKSTGVRAAPSWLVPPPDTTRIAIASLVLLPVGFLLFRLGVAHRGVAPREAWPDAAVAYLVLGALAVFFLRRRPLAAGEICLVVFAGLPGLLLGVLGIVTLVR